MTHDFQFARIVNLQSVLAFGGWSILYTMRSLGMAMSVRSIFNRITATLLRVQIGQTSQMAMVSQANFKMNPVATARKARRTKPAP